MSPRAEDLAHCEDVCIYKIRSTPLDCSINEETNETITDVEHVVSIKPSDIRMNDDYIFYYNNLAKLIITGIVPFAALCVFNFKVCQIYIVSYILVR